MAVRKSPYQTSGRHPGSLLCSLLTVVCLSAKVRRRVWQIFNESSILLLLLVWVRRVGTFFFFLAASQPEAAGGALWAANVGLFYFSVRLIRSTSAFMLAGYTQEIDRSQSNADAGKRCSCCRWQIPGQIQTFYNSKNKCLCFIWVIHALNVSSWGGERHTRELTSVFSYSVNSG